MIKTVMGDFLEIHEAAEAIGRTTKALHSLNSRGTGPRYYKLGNKCGYKRSDLIVWLELNRVR